jgi:hypothetical protein
VHRDAAEGHRHAVLTRSCPVAAARVAAERHDPDPERGEDGDVADGAVDDDAGPAVGQGQAG